jgi:hypothetical protein
VIEGQDLFTIWGAGGKNNPRQHGPIITVYRNNAAGPVVGRGCTIQGWPRHRGALEAILSRSLVPILRQLEDKQPELVMALLPSLVRTMLAAFVEVVAEERASKK